MWLERRKSELDWVEYTTLEKDETNRSIDFVQHGLKKKYSKMFKKPWGESAFPPCTVSSGPGSDPLTQAWKPCLWLELTGGKTWKLGVSEVPQLREDVHSEPVFPFSPLALWQLETPEQVIQQASGWRSGLLSVQQRVPWKPLLGRSWSDQFWKGVEN